MGNRWRTAALLLTTSAAVVTAACARTAPLDRASPVPASATWPGDITVPKSAPALPDDRPVGPAVAAYRVNPDSRDVYLVTMTGDQYLIPVLGERHMPKPQPTSGSQPPPEEMPLDPMFGLQLSPDGRWLVRVDWAKGSVLRDLTGTATVQLDRADQPMTWSPGGRLVLLDVRSAAKEGSAILEPATGRRTPIADKVCGEGFSERAVFDDGKILCAPLRQMESTAPEVPNGTELFRVANAAGGYREFTVDLRGRLRDQAVVIAPLQPDSAGHLVVTAFDSRSRVFLVSLADGKLVTEVTLPDEQVQGYDAWSFGGLDGDRLLAVRQVEIGSPSPLYEPTRIVRLVPAGGEPEVVATFPRQAVIILKGGR
jgi:hypothetical protein